MRTTNTHTLERPTCFEQRYFLNADQIGSLVLDVAQDGIEGRIVANFSHSLAIQVGSLVLALTELPDGLPLGISVRTLPTIEDRSWIGTKVRLDCEKLTIADTGYQINFRKASVWNGKARMSTIEPRVDGLLKRLAFVRCWVLDQGLSFGHGFLNPDKDPDRDQNSGFYDLSDQLLSIFSVYNQPNHNPLEGHQLERILKQIIGLGPGLTPSGDDYLTGLLLSIWAGEKSSLVLPIIRKQLSGKILNLGQKYTNSFSWSYLYSACMGHGAQAVVEVLESLLAGTRDPKDAVFRLSNIGGSSGTDTLLGIMVGLQRFVLPDVLKVGKKERVHGNGKFSNVRDILR